MNLKRTLRDFCLKHQLDPGNTSRLEHGLLSPPQKRDRLEEYAGFLELTPGSEDWHTFFDLAAVAGGRLPKELLEKQEVAGNLPQLFRVLRESPLKAEEFLEKPVASSATDSPVQAVSAKEQRNLQTASRLWIAVGCCLGILVLVIFLTHRSASLVPPQFAITDAMICAGIDEEKRPLGITAELPPGSERVFCWFSWKGAPLNLQLIGRWYYVPKPVQVLDIPLTLTKPSADGILSLQMPSGKRLPVGLYRIDLIVKGRVVKTVPFMVGENAGSVGTKNGAKNRPDALPK